MKATGYEESWNKTYGVDRDPVRQHLIFPLLSDHSRDLSGKRILDAGCGNGNLLNCISEQKYQSAIGIDRSQQFLDAARANIPDDRVRFVCSDLLEPLPFENRSFDVVYSVFVLNELPAVEGHIAELSRVLDSEGRLLLVVTHPFFALYYHLFERFTGKPNEKLVGVRGYFDQNPIQYVFTLSKATATFFQHTFAALLNPIAASGLRVTEILELRTDGPNFSLIPSYKETSDMPKFLFIEARKL
jgi:ubiquinone/menaquinone biosynthesis C-methylase UbiE